MVSIPRNIKYNGIYSGRGITFLMTGALNAHKQHAVTWDTKSHAENSDGVFVKLAGDDDPVVGRLEAILDQVRSDSPGSDVVTVTVLTEGMLALPAISSSTSGDFLPGTYAIGAGDGEVKSIAPSSDNIYPNAPEVVQYDETTQTVIAFFR